MSRTVRKKLFTMAGLQEEMYRAIEESLVKRNSDDQGEELSGLLADAQEGAISMGNMVEALCGEGTDTVRELEDYCETLYQMSQASDLIDGQKKLLSQLQEHLWKIRHFLEKDVPDKREVVFLPYKASMWDSLESVWMAAKEDKDADVYVIPIPYYDRNPDGTFREEHYEGELFPDYVEITHYDDYNFELRRPEMVFIHNPYDDGNYVTSVHPFFYSKNIKRFTEKLVYIPYYIWDGKVVAEHVMMVKVLLYADYIIVQNEKEKEEYIRQFETIFPGFDLARKLLPLGSPKTDKVRSLNRESVEVPEEWKKKAKGKKVIFYNTSVNGLLQGNELYLKKVKEVIRFFAEREDAVLLWRPHPLIEATLLSTRSELYEKYMEIKDQFIREDIGIFDNTSDMYPAIGLSDAYYGDWSSVVWLYKETGKPVLIQNVENS